MELFRKLNREQLEAVTAPIEGYNLVIASAGTGKTSTIVARIGYLLRQGVDPRSILLLTFTNKAAEEMKSRLTAHFPEAELVEGGTFHGVSYRWLKKSNSRLVVKPPKEMKLLLRSIYEKRELYRLDSETRPFSAPYLYDLYSLAQNSGILEIDGFIKWLEERYPEQETFLWAYEDILTEFEQIRREHNLIDFNTLLIEMVERLGNGIENPYRYVLVDEYQDTNPLQGLFIDRIEQGSLFCVGDYDQSIYGFNGADISIISTFRERYPYARVYTLKKNYRSYGEILEIANRVIRFNPRIYPKKLEVTRGYSGTFPPLLTYFDTYQQYRAIAQKIACSTTPREEIAVLFRNNSSGDGIEGFLREMGVGVKRRGGISFFESREVKWISNLLNLLVNPKDIMAFIGVVEYGKGIGSGIAGELFGVLSRLGMGNVIKGIINPNRQINPFPPARVATQLGLFGDRVEEPSIGKFKKIGIKEDFLSHPVLKTPKLSPEGGLFLYFLYLFLKKINASQSTASKSISSLKLTNFNSTSPKNEIFQLETFKPAEIIAKIKTSQLWQEVKKSIALLRSKDRNGKIDREKFLDQLERADIRLSILEKMGDGYRDIAGFLTGITLGANEITEGRGVNLMTVHASKGLEFREVYLIDLMDGRFPNTRLATSGAGLEEERRLFYVAVTRAKDRLIMSMAYRDGQSHRTYKPSQFLSEAKYTFPTPK